VVGFYRGRYMCAMRVDISLDISRYRSIASSLDIYLSIESSRSTRDSDLLFVAYLASRCKV